MGKGFGLAALIVAVPVGLSVLKQTFWSRPRGKDKGVD